MLRVKLLVACCALLGAAGGLGIVVGHATSPILAAAQPLPALPAAPTTTAPSPRTGRTTVSSPFAAIDNAYTALGKAIADYKAAHAAPTPAPSPSPSPVSPPAPSARFPGDPGPGRIVVGAIVSGGAGDADGFEKATGAKLGVHRAYWNNGISDLAPNGPAMSYIRAEQAAGRIPHVSVKLNWQQTAAGAYDTQLRAFRDAVEALPKPVWLTVNHEPENDGQPAAAFVAEQRHIRKVIGTGLHRLAFIGSLMAYDWATASGRTPDTWFPGPGVWDACGLDQYAQKAGGPIDDAKFEAALVSLKKWGCVPAITELGIRVADPQAAAKAKALFEKLIADGFATVQWFDSDNNSTGAGWVLTPGPLRDEFVAMLEDQRAAHPAA